MNNETRQQILDVLHTAQRRYRSDPRDRRAADYLREIRQAEAKLATFDKIR